MSRYVTIFDYTDKILIVLSATTSGVSTLISKNKIKGESRCAICFTRKSFTDDIKYDLESALEVYLQLFTD